MQTSQEQAKHEVQLEWVNCNYCGSSSTRLVYDFSPLKIVMCKRCGLVYTNPRLDPRIIRERLYGADVWKGYEEYYARNLPAVRQFCRKWLQKLGDYADVKQWKICEIGPGLGVFLDEARRRGHEVYGVDVSQYAIDYARAKFGIDTIRQASADAIDSLGFAKMDVMVMLASIEHLPDPSAVLRKINDCLLEDGLLLLSTGVWGSFNQIFARKAWAIIGPERHLYYFSKRTIRALLKKAGFSLLTLETNSTLINELTKNKWLVGQFNNPIARRLLAPVSERLRLGDEMFIISRKLPRS